MIDGVNVSAGTNQEGEQILENIAIAGASAIQRLISERNNLRARVNMQQVDLVNLRTAKCRSSSMCHLNSAPLH